MSPSDALDALIAHQRRDFRGVSAAELLALVDRVNEPTPCARCGSPTCEDLAHLEACTATTKGDTP